MEKEPKENIKEHIKTFKDFVKKQAGKGHNKAGAFIGAGAELIESGALGVDVAGLENRLNKFRKNFPKKENIKKHTKNFKSFVKKQAGKEHNKAGAFIGAGASAGLIEGGALGVAVGGTAFGVPLVVAGAGVGLAGYGAYKAGQAIYKKGRGKKTNSPEKP